MSVSTEPEAKRAREASPGANASASTVAPLSAPAATPAATATTSTSAPRPKHNVGKAKRRRNYRKLPEPYSPAEVTYRDVVDALGQEYVDGVLVRGDESEWDVPEGLELQEVVEVVPVGMTVSGECCGLWQCGEGCC